VPEAVIAEGADTMHEDWTSVNRITPDRKGEVRGRNAEPILGKRRTLAITAVVITTVGNME